MIKRNTKLILLFVAIYSFNMMAQAGLERTLKGYTAPDELVSLSANLPFSKAVELINKVSEKKTGRKVLSLVKREDPIGVEIVNVAYDKALLMIVQYAGLI
jgi:HJR/Mrr/RecB family endonuclease